MHPGCTFLGRRKHLNLVGAAVEGSPLSIREQLECRELHGHGASKLQSYLGCLGL